MSQMLLVAIMFQAYSYNDAQSTPQAREALLSLLLDDSGDQISNCQVHQTPVIPTHPL